MSRESSPSGVDAGLIFASINKSLKLFSNSPVPPTMTDAVSLKVSVAIISSTVESPVNSARLSYSSA